MPQATEPSDPSLRYLPYGDTAIAYSDEGAGGTTILAVPGIPGSSRDFRWLAPELARHSRVIRFDPPGFGGSRRPAFAGMSTAERAETARTVIERLELDPVVLVGHSAGGAAVAHVSRHHAELVRGCVLLSPSGPTPHFSRAPLQVAAAVLRLPGGQRVWAPALRRLFASQGFPAYLTDRERALSVLDAAEFDFADHRANLSAVGHPTMVAWAHDDGVIPAETFRALERMVPPGPRLEFVSGGHNLQKTRATDLARAILDFADSSG